MAKNGQKIDLEQYQWTDETDRQRVLTNLYKTGEPKIAAIHGMLFPRDPNSESDRLHARTDALVSHLHTVVARAIEEAVDEIRISKFVSTVEVGAGDGEIIRGLIKKLLPRLRSALKVIAIDPNHNNRPGKDGIFFLKGSVDDYARNTKKIGMAGVLINTADLHHAGTEEEIKARIRALTRLVLPGGRLILTDTVHGEDASSWRRDFETTIACHSDTDVLGNGLSRAQTYLKPSDVRQVILEAGMQIEEELARSPSSGAREYHHTILARKPVSL